LGISCPFHNCERSFDFIRLHALESTRVKSISSRQPRNRFENRPGIVYEPFPNSYQKDTPVVQNLGELTETMSHRFRLWDCTEQCIVESHDNLGVILLFIQTQETSLHENPFEEGRILQIMKRNDIKNKFDVLFTLVRGRAGWE